MNTASDNPLLTIDQVTLRFGGITAVDNVSLALNDGQLLGFIGPNGAGKTTLMRIITGVLRPHSGWVKFNGQNVTRWPIDRRIRAGIALGQQIVKPLKSLNLLDNVALAAGSGRMVSPFAALLATGRDKERTTAQRLLDSVGIGDFAQAMPDELPLGYLKRLEVARALALKPRLLLLDEPLAGLNQTEARSMADLIAALVKPTLSVLLIEHNIREVARICPMLYVQNNGRQLLYGPTETVMADAQLRRAYLGGANSR